MSPPPDRSERLSVRMSKTEMDMLEKLADAKGVSASDVVRLFIREAHAQQFPEPSFSRQPSPKKKVEK